jgi:hypothetical protein
VRQTLVFTALVLFVALAGPALYGYIYTADDLGAFHLPLRDFYAQALESGDAFDWCPHLYGGFYLTGEGQVGTYHPLHWLLYRWLPLSSAWNIECLVSYPLLFAGMLVFLRGQRLPAAASLAGAIFFTFCSFNLLHFVHINAVAVIAHVPWLLYAIDRMNDALTPAGRIRGALFIAALTGSQLLLGYPQYVLYSLVAEVVYLAFAMRGAARLSTQGAPIRRLALWSAAKAFGLALGAVQILPTLDALAESVRASTDAEFAGWGSLHPLNVAQLVAPYLFATRVAGQNTHELTFYAGAVPLLLAVLAVFNVKRLPGGARGRTLTNFAIVLSLVGFVIALGSYGPVHRLTSALPLAGAFRFPCRAVVLVQLGIALVAAAGFAALLRGADAARSTHKSDGADAQIPVKSFAAVVLLSIALSIAGPIVWSDHVAAPPLVWAGPCLLAAAVCLIVRVANGGRLAIHGIVLLTAIDLGLYGLSYSLYRDVDQLEDFVAAINCPPIDSGHRVALDLASATRPGIRAGNQVLLRGYSRVDGYAGLEPARSLDYRETSALRLAGVDAVAGQAPVANRGHFIDAGQNWLRLPDPSPRARLVRQYVATDRPDRDIQTINTESTNTESTALISPEDRETVAMQLGSPATRFDAQTHKPLTTDAIRLAADRPGRIALEVASQQPQLLVLTERYHDGWSATIDGQSASTLRVNGDFLGCLVSGGTTDVEFRFTPQSLQIGRASSLCGLGFWGLFFAMTWLPRFRRPQDLTHALRSARV